MSQLEGDEELFSTFFKAHGSRFTKGIYLDVNLFHLLCVCLCVCVCVMYCFLKELSLYWKLDFCGAHC